MVCGYQWLFQRAWPGERRPGTAASLPVRNVIAGPSPLYLFTDGTMTHNCVMGRFSVSSFHTSKKGVDVIEKVGRCTDEHLVALGLFLGEFITDIGDEFLVSRALGKDGQ